MKSKIIITASCICVLTLAFFSILYDLRVNNSAVATITSMWSVVSTIALGGVAIWQNKRYKELSELNNRKLEELTRKPEIFLEDIRNYYCHEDLDKPCKGVIIADELEEAGDEDLNLFFVTINFPVIDFKIKSVKGMAIHQDNALKDLKIIDDLFEGVPFRYDQLSIYGQNSKFCFRMNMPKEFINRDSLYIIEFTYMNIYLESYIKKISFEIKYSIDEHGFDDYSVLNITEGQATKA